MGVHREWRTDRHMLCEDCRANQAEVHLTSIEVDEMSTIHLCVGCASRRGLSPECSGSGLTREAAAGGFPCPAGVAESAGAGARHRRALPILWDLRRGLPENGEGGVLAMLCALRTSASWPPAQDSRVVAARREAVHQRGHRYFGPSGADLIHAATDEACDRDGGFRDGSGTA